MRATDARLEHAAAPYRNSVVATDIVNSARFLVASDPPEFDVDDPAGADLDGFARVVRRVDRLIEADRRLDLLLKFGMIDHVFVMQRLLEHHHALAIHFLED